MPGKAGTNGRTLVITGWLACWLMWILRYSRQTQQAWEHVDIWPRGDHFSWQSEIHFARISKDFLFCGIVRPRHVTCDISILGSVFMKHFFAGHFSTKFSYWLVANTSRARILMSQNLEIVANISSLTFHVDRYFSPDDLWRPFRQSFGSDSRRYS